MNIPIGKIVRVINIYSKDVSKRGIICSSPSPKFYCVRILEMVRCFHELDLEILDDCLMPLVNCNNSYCYWCDTFVIRRRFIVNKFVKFINYCPNCLR